MELKNNTDLTKKNERTRDDLLPFWRTKHLQSRHQWSKLVNYSNHWETLKFITILVFILLFPVSRSPPVRTYLSIYGGQKGWWGLTGAGGEGTRESNYGLRLPDWQQIIFMSLQEDRKNDPWFFSPWLLLWKRTKPTQSSPVAGNSSIAHIHKGQTGTKYSNVGNLADAHFI